MRVRWRLARTWRVYATDADGLVLRRGHWWRHEFVTLACGSRHFPVGTYVDLL